ncbi:conserved hypothetical protein [Candidatus Sulfobium mesophilum]|uniref:Type 4 fimbrial biogenesis protein PilX N-terminal domain-containing protein n=1 Tax=Candidatus Sulfobium mesophilum TaxID=2016548 RepID=A0A2U3QGM2_9BACT|nr:conserved hypothetical protein [Candidatus Sulfobium mesophilum]
MKNKIDNKEPATGWRSLSSESGIALVLVLVLAAMGLAIMAALFYMLTASTQISGIQKRYRTAVEAGKGGAQVAYKVISMRGDPGVAGINFAFTAPFLASGNDCNGNNVTCLNAKLNQPTSCWPAACNSALTIDTTAPSTYDFSMDLGTTQTYRAYAKIVDTVQGNSGGDLGLIKSGVVSANSGEVPAMSIPYLYTMEIDAENIANPQERAKYSILYQY